MVRGRWFCAEWGRIRSTSPCSAPIFIRLSSHVCSHFWVCVTVADFALATKICAACNMSMWPKGTYLHPSGFEIVLGGDPKFREIYINELSEREILSKFNLFEILCQFIYHLLLKKVKKIIIFNSKNGWLIMVFLNKMSLSNFF